MIGEIQGDGATVAAGFTPRILLNTKEITGLVVIYELVIFEIDGGSGIGDIEGIALIGGDIGILGHENGFTGSGIARHRLIEEDVFVGGGLTV